MKLRILAVLVAVAALCAVGLSQTHDMHKGSHMASKQGQKMAAMYACPKCEMASMKRGKCPGCKSDMVKIRGKKVYMCPKCHMLGKKGATCSHCNKKLVPGVETYACDHCHTSAMKAGKCPGCGMEMKKHDLPLMGGKG